MNKEELQEEINNCLDCQDQLKQFNRRCEYHTQIIETMRLK